MDYRKFTHHELDLGWAVAAISRAPSESMKYADYATTLVGDRFRIGYLVDDRDVQNPLEDCDGFGAIYSSHRHSRQHCEMQVALGLNSDWEPDLDLVEVEAERRLEGIVKNSAYAADLVAYRIELAKEIEGISLDEAIRLFIQEFRNADEVGDEGSWLFEKVSAKHSWDDILHDCWVEGRIKGTVGDPYAIMLDCYEHGGQHWSLSGQGMQCAFDTARGAGVWVPDEVLREDLDAIALKDGRDAAMAKAREFAQQALDVFNAWLLGDCYGIVVEEYRRTTDGLVPLDTHEVWGYVGMNWAIEAMKDETSSGGAILCLQKAGR